PGRPRRKWLRWLAMPAAAAVLILAYYLTRPPELVWWSNRSLGGTRVAAKLRVPRGWTLSSTHRADGTTASWCIYEISPTDARPLLLRILLPIRSKSSRMSVWLGESFWPKSLQREDAVRVGYKGINSVRKLLTSEDGKSWAILDYSRNDCASFN